MNVFVVLLCGFATVLTGRVLLKSWFNHLTIFGLLWSLSLALYDLHLLRYYEIDSNTWFLILAGWISFVLGAVTVVLARRARGGTSHLTVSQPAEVWTDRQLQFLVRMIWVLSFIALLATIQHWQVLIEKFGSIPRILVLANLVYRMRVSDEIPGMIPYVDSLILVAILMAGVVTAATGRIRMVSIVPLIIAILAEMAMMGRARLILAGILFLTGYSFQKAGRKSLREGGSAVWKRALTVAAVVAIFASGAELVRTSRGMIETFQGAKRSLNTLKEASFITPSIYLYITVNPVIFDQYLKDNVERTPVASNTLAPVYRVLAKLGFETDIPRYQRFYKAPQNANTGTYLRELHADFGVAGVLLFPFAISAVTTILCVRMQNRFRFTSLILIGYLYSIVGMSLFYIATRSGNLLTYLFVGLVCGRILDGTFTRGDRGRTPTQAFQ